MMLTLFNTFNAFALSNIYGKSKFCILYPVNTSTSASFTKLVHFVKSKRSSVLTSTLTPTIGVVSFKTKIVLLLPIPPTPDPAG